MLALATRSEHKKKKIISDLGLCSNFFFPFFVRKQDGGHPQPSLDSKNTIFIAEKGKDLWANTKIVIFGIIICTFGSSTYIKYLTQ